ncbi:hypothetical protein [Endozoicomonas ascidiicola]|uniref:hypothetical protein n=1 Tax=Endozoicomonas ascidiicola TaxID=1698521 RepID=UPI00082E7527|nr:hypothetical protein [Endozoicomonas ascidiicola]
MSEPQNTYGYWQQMKKLVANDIDHGTGDELVAQKLNQIFEQSDVSGVCDVKRFKAKSFLNVLAAIPDLS